MIKAVIENGVVINIIEHDKGHLIMPEGQMYVPANGQPVGIGMSYDYITGGFGDAPGIPQRTETIENDLTQTQLALAELAAIITEGGEA